MKGFIDRHPSVFCGVLLAVLLGLAYVFRSVFPTAIIGSVSDIAPGTATEPSALDRILAVFRDAGTLFWALAIALAGVWLAVLGWSEAGFGGSVRWRNLYLLWFPLGVAAFSLTGGVGSGGAGYLVAALLGVVISVVGEELIFRGVMWRALISRGPLRAILSTAFFTGVLYLGNAALASRPLPEIVFNTLTAACAAITYGALRWRTGTLWPVVIVHAVLAYTRVVSQPSIGIYQLSLLVSIVGFTLYGLFLLRNRPVRADGG